MHAAHGFVTCPLKLLCKVNLKSRSFFTGRQPAALWSDLRASGARTSPSSRRPRRRSAWPASRSNSPAQKPSSTSSFRPRERSPGQVQELHTAPSQHAPAGSAHNTGTKPVKRIVFWNIRDGPWIPTLRLLQRYPTLLPVLLTDASCPKFILQGAQMMAPGIHQMDQDLPRGAIVSVSIQGAPPFYIGRLTQAGKEIMAEGRHEQAVETLNIIGDGFWEYGDDYK